LIFQSFVDKFLYLQCNCSCLRNSVGQ